MKIIQKDGITIITAILTEDLLQKAEALIAEDTKDHIGE